MDKKTLKERMAHVARPGEKVRVHWMIPDEQGNVESPGLPGGEGTIYGGGVYRIACDPAEWHKPGCSATGETHAVTCQECMRHPLFAEQYEPRPGVTYDKIPKEVRDIIEQTEAEAAKVKAAAGEGGEKKLADCPGCP